MNNKAEEVERQVRDIIDNLMDNMENSGETYSSDVLINVGIRVLAAATRTLFQEGMLSYEEQEGILDKIAQGYRDQATAIAHRVTIN